MNNESNSSVIYFNTSPAYNRKTLGQLAGVVVGMTQSSDTYEQVLVRLASVMPFDLKIASEIGKVFTDVKNDTHTRIYSVGFGGLFGVSGRLPQDLKEEINKPGFVRDYNRLAEVVVELLKEDK